jgi:CYTH domain-containing protein
MNETVERERKWIVDGVIPLEEPRRKYELRQAYITDPYESYEVRVRKKINLNSCAIDYYLTVKSSGSAERRTQMECGLTQDQFGFLWEENPGRQIQKTRRVYPVSGVEEDLEIELDSFHGFQLQIAEVEFSSESELEYFDPPDWFGKEVTGDKRYTNAWMAAHGKPLKKPDNLKP